MTYYIIWTLEEKDDVINFYKFVTEGKEVLAPVPYPNGKKFWSGSTRLSRKQANILLNSNYNIEVTELKPFTDFVDYHSQLPDARDMPEQEMLVMNGTPLLLIKSGKYISDGEAWIYTEPLPS